jgi:acetyltransferase
MIAQSRVEPEAAHDILRHARRHPLDPLFAPKTVAVIGATEKEGSVGAMASCCSIGSISPTSN